MTTDSIVFKVTTIVNGAVSVVLPVLLVSVALAPSLHSSVTRPGTVTRPSTAYGVATSMVVSVNVYPSCSMFVWDGPALLVVATGLCTLRNDEEQLGIVVLMLVVVVEVLLVVARCVARVFGRPVDVLGGRW